jgi:hypothetical protein
MKQYLLSVHMVEGEPQPPPEEMEQSFKDTGAFNEEVQQAGRWVFAGGLHPADTATVVRAQGDEVITSDGPFAEAKEHLGGFWIIKAEDLDDAMRWAARGSAACRAPVEVRPFQDDAEG